MNTENFCTKCGAQNPSTFWLCKYCNSKNEANSNFCANCGKEKSIADSGNVFKNEDELNKEADKDFAQQDNSAMGQIANAIQLALSDMNIYDEVLYSTVKYNASCYIDRSLEGDVESFKEIIKKDGDSIVEYTYKSNARLADGEKYYFAGQMRGVTITFSPTNDENTGNSVINIADGVVNAPLVNGARVVSDLSLGTATYYGGNEWQGKKISEMESTASNQDHHHLYNRVRTSVGDSITLTSQTYRNSDYTIFIRMGTTGGNSAAGWQDSVRVYGQWNGTNL